MTTQSVSGASPQSQQAVDLSKYDMHIQVDDKNHPINIDVVVQMLFLQYNQVMNLRTQDKLDETKGSLQEMTDTQNMYSQMKLLRAKAKSTGSTTNMPADMKAWLQARDIKLGGDDIYNTDEWDVMMTKLDSYSQKISGQNKTQMLELNQCVEDGNNALREVSTVFSKYTEIIQSIIQTVNR